MADLTTSNFQIVSAWSEGGVAGKRRIGKKIMLIANGAVNSVGETNHLTATVLGMRVIEECTNAVDASGLNSIFLAAPSPTGDRVVFSNPAAASALPTDLNLQVAPNGLHLTVKGY